MKKKLHFMYLLIMLLTAGVFTSSYAADYWVDDNGTATWAQAQSSTPLSGAAATTLDEANANARPGDIIYLRAGNYTTIIQPANSGDPGNPITYQNYLGEDVVYDGTPGAVLLDNRHYIIVDGITAYRTTRAWVDMINSSSYNIIRNCVFETAYVWGGVNLATGTHHNTIKNCSFLATCTRTTPYPGRDDGSFGLDLTNGGPADFIYQGGTQYDLIEGNDFQQGGFHYAITGKTSYSIYRNNIFHNRWHGNHNIVGNNQTRNVVENNIMYEAGRDRDTNYCGQPRDRDMAPEKQNQYGSTDLKYTIVRGNVIIDGGNSGSSNYRGDILNQHVYNNTFYKNEYNYKLFGDNPDYKFDGEIFINNILAKAVQYELIIVGTAYSGNTISYNNIWNADGAIVQFRNNTADSNLNTDPQFINEAAIPINSDLHLKPTSPMIDAGRWHTTIVSPAGTGSGFQVADAGFFIDGYGIVKGDVIQLEGQDTPIRIVNIDYMTNTLFVDRSISWTQGLGVALPYNGSKPDMGAYEFVEASAENQSPYKGVAWELPGVLEAENYDDGGEGVAYHDLSVGNNGGKYRTDDVDLYVAGDIGGGYHVGDTEAGEWLEYTINVFNGGTYNISARIASTVNTGKYSISIDGVNVTGAVDIPNTGGDQIWQTVAGSNVNMATGLHILRIDIIAGGFNLNSITVADTEPPTAPTSLTVTDLTSSSITIAWTASSDNVGVVEYDVYRNGMPVKTVYSTEYTDKQLVPGKTYSYTVVAKDIAGNGSPQSVPTEGTTLQYQKITISPIEDKYTNDPPFEVEATVSSGLPLTYEVSGPATISGKTITLTGETGTVEVTVTQAGNTIYGRTSSTTSFEVMLITGIEDQSLTLRIYPIPATDWLRIEGAYSDNARVQIIDIMGKQILFQRFTNNRISVKNLAEGTYIMNISDLGIIYRAKIIIQR